MSEYSKKLHIRKNGSIENITLYTSRSDLTSSNALSIRDNGTIVYAPLGTSSDGETSHLHIRKNGTVFSVLKTAVPSGSRTFSADESGYQEQSFSLPNGVKKIQVYYNFYGESSGTETLTANGTINIRMNYRRSGSRTSTVLSIKSNDNEILNKSIIGKLSLTCTISWSAAINNS